MEPFLWAFAYIGAGILVAVFTTRLKIWTDNAEDSAGYLGLVVLLWPIIAVICIGYGIVWLLGAVVQRLSAKENHDGR